MIKKSRTQINYVAYVQPHDFNSLQSSIRSTSFNKFGIFGYSQKSLTEEGLRAIIAPILSCRIDHQENCEEKMDANLKRTFYVYGGHDNLEGMSKLNTLMEEVEMGRNTIENLTVLRFSNLVFMPLWNRNYIHHIQVTFSEELGMQISARGIVHSHIFQKVALLAIEPPVTLDGEDVRYEKVKVLKSIRKLESSDVILGHCEADSGSNFKDVDNLMPTYFGAVLHIDNARWHSVPFLIKAGRGLKKNRVEFRIQICCVAGNLYHKAGGKMQDLAINELILRDVPDEAILVRINNKIPGLGMNLEASELNLLYKDKYNVDVTDSYEQLLHDVIDGDNHLFMLELDNNNVTLEHYEFGSKGPDKASDLWAKHGVKWLDD
ncbi:unnamed protein product [Withania somnifera]